MLYTHAQSLTCSHTPHRSILLEHSNWHKYCWTDLDTGELLAGVEKQQEKVCSLPGKIVEDWDLYLYLTQAVATVQLSVPMVEGLKR